MDPRRLCHISDLPNNLTFLPIQLKHLLPIHHPKFIDNLHTIISHQSHNSSWPVYPDLSLTMSNPHYLVLSGGWCQDIDGKDGHLKATLQLAAVVLNYICTLLEAPSHDQEYKNAKNVRRADHIGMSPLPAHAFLPQVLAYNIYKTKDKNNNNKLIFMVGYHRSPQLRLYSLLSAVRDMNLHRFKSDLCRQISFSRIPKVTEHLITILRGFLPLKQDDHLGKQRQLQIIIKSLNIMSLPKQLPRQGIDQSHQVVLSRFQWNYQNKPQQKDIAIFIAEIITELCTVIPVDVACSFVAKGCHQEKMNIYVLMWMTAFKKNKGNMKVNVAEKDDMKIVAMKGTGFLRRQTVEAIKDSTTNIADQMLRSSLKVLSRYAPGQQRTNARDWANQTLTSRVRQNSIKSQSSTIKLQIPRNPDFDRMSLISRISFKQSPLTQAKPRPNSQFDSLSSPLMTHRDKQYSQLLLFITKWQQFHGNIFSNTELQGMIRRNCQMARQRYGENSNIKNCITKGEGQLLMACAALKKYLEMDQYFLLLKYHTQHRDAIFQVIFQGSSAKFLLDLAIRISKEYARSLYDHYITKNFTIDSNNLLPAFMKRLVAVFAANPQIQDFGDKVSVPILIQLLQTKNLVSQNYRILTKQVLPSIFSSSNPALRLICPILNTVYLVLAQDHHQQLLNGFLADLSFETIYFHHDIGMINNSPYRKSKDIRQNKLLQLLRIGKFNALGYQLKSCLQPIIFQFRDYSLPSARIYDEITIHRPLLLVKFVELIASSTFVQHLPEVTNKFKEMTHIANTVTRSIGNVYLQSQIQKYTWENQQDITSGVFKSQSGIFQQLLEYNPQIKLAGRQLSQVIKTRQTQKPVIPQRFDSNYVLSTIFRQNLQQIYEYIVIANNLKEKYDIYDSLKEDQRIYLREIVHQVLCKKSDIVEYLELSFLAKRFAEMQVPYLF